MGMKGRIALGAVVGIAVIGTVSANAGDGGTDGSAGGKGTSASGHRHSDDRSGGRSGAEKGAGRAAGREAAFEGDGDFRVGTDIEPGTYRTTGNTDGTCYWERAEDASGELDSLLANDNVTGTGYVTVKPTDKLFESSGCNDWEAVDPRAQGSPAVEMAGEGGMFRVGTDIAPGTYESAGNTDDSCYWERAKDAEHSIDSVIANDNASGTAVVTIGSADRYFKTTGCQDWKKTG
ncbi:hypothetical protein SUDANB58_02279 [Streptomyces sp. enrichment culture]|uniref:hypothetical protein n=1 Tax=Streptomyces sp. enrichment culture TaxID=1795815 RepID=UPI003F5626D3